MKLAEISPQLTRARLARMIQAEVEEERTSRGEVILDFTDVEAVSDEFCQALLESLLEIVSIVEFRRMLDTGSMSGDVKDVMLRVMQRHLGMEDGPISLDRPGPGAAPINPFILADGVARSYKSYVLTTFPLLDPALRTQVEKHIDDEHLLWRGPFVSLAPYFARGAGPRDLASAKVIHPDLAVMFQDFEALFAHQVVALKRIQEGRHTLVSSSTGSGKTESFLLPVLDYCLKHRDEKGVKALLLYPMNALVNDQLKRLRERLSGTGITYARYTGETPQGDRDPGRPKPALLPPGTKWDESKHGSSYIPAEERWSREAIRDEPPDILITNYTMLEFLLVRGEDQKIFKPRGKPSVLRFLVLDEIHTYVGSLGAEIGCLIRRLREHTDRTESGLVCIGTSATVADPDGKDRAVAAVTRFASNLFATRFEPDSLIEEESLERVPEGESYWPPIPADLKIDEMEKIRSLPVVYDPGESGKLSGLADDVRRLAQKLTGRSLPSGVDLGAALASVLSANELVRWLEEQLTGPVELDLLPERLGMLPQRAGIDAGQLLREIVAYLVLGTYARTDEGPLLRPKLHVFYRGLANFFRCSDTRCGRLLENGQETCPACGAVAWPLEICRTCGQDYYKVEPRSGNDPGAAPIPVGFESLGPPADMQRWESTETTWHLAHRIQEIPSPFAGDEEAGDEEDEDEEEGDPSGANSLRGAASLRYCPRCSLASEDSTHRDCMRCREPLHDVQRVRTGKFTRCKACHDRNNREIVTLLRSGTASSVATLSSLLLHSLKRDDQRRLLVFSDSRQDTAYQAGYIRDTVQQFSWRQLIVRVLRNRREESQDPAIGVDLTALPGLVYQEGIRPELSLIPREDQQTWKDRLDWDIAREFTATAQQRHSLESLGLVEVRYTHLDTLLQSDGMKKLAQENELGATTLKGILVAFLDHMRRHRSLSLPALARHWSRKMDGPGSRVAVPVNLRKPVGFRDHREPKSRYFTVEGLVAAGRGQTVLQTFASRIGLRKASDFLLEIRALLVEDGLLVERTIGGSTGNQQTRAWQVNAGRVQVGLPQTLWRCRSCRRLYGTPAGTHCANYSCEPDTLQPGFRPDPENYYVKLYDMFPVPTHAQEHSGQIAGSLREAYERAFVEGKINLLVCTPTLELGVDIGPLVTVLMRNVPPSPSNYAQRAGRAGRKLRIALINVFSQSSPHDSYFYNHPHEMIRGAIRSPHVQIDNDYIIRRHVHSLILEKLDSQLPKLLGDFLDFAGGEPRLKGHQAVVAELATKKDGLVRAVEAAFSPDRRMFPDSLTWLDEETIRSIVDEFPGRLQKVLEAWFSEYMSIMKELVPLLEEEKHRTLTKEKAQREAWLKGVRYRLTEDENQAYTLGYLGSHGFLPRYAFPGEAASLLIDGSLIPELTRDRGIALQEFAPGNLVYVAGRKVLVHGLNFRKGKPLEEESFGSQEEERYFVCPKCGYLMRGAGIRHCPRCPDHPDLDGHLHLGAAHYQGYVLEDITAAEEARSRKFYEIASYLVGEPEEWIQYSYPGLELRFMRRHEILEVNQGFRLNSRDESVQPFRICLRCGKWHDPVRQPNLSDWESDHRKKLKCPGRHERLHLTYSRHTPILLLQLAEGSQDEVLTTTLMHALLLGIRLTVEADIGEVAAFPRDVPHSSGMTRELLFHETIAGGAGYLEQIGDRLPEVCRLALEALTSHECVGACYACLKHYRNQRDHGLLDKQRVLELLERIARAPSAEGGYRKREIGRASTQEILKTESPIEELLLVAIEGASLPVPSPQVEIRDGDQFVARPDFVYEKEKIAIFCDGREFHTRPGHVEHDAEQRSRLKGMGYSNVVLPGARIVHRIHDCLADLQSALKRAFLDPLSKLIRDPPPDRRYVDLLPVYSLVAACGRFGRGDEVSEEGWLEVGRSRPLREGMFAARVSGRSMEPMIPEGSFCIFRAPVEGSRQGKTVLVQHHGFEDPETGGRYTVKRYESEKREGEDGAFTHSRIVLRPFNHDFEPLVFESEAEAEGLTVIAEFVGVV